MVLEPVANPHKTLRALLELYWRGTRRLLHFFPRSALAYVEKLDKDGDGERVTGGANRVGGQRISAEPSRAGGWLLSLGIPRYRSAGWRVR